MVVDQTIAAQGVAGKTRVDRACTTVPNPPRAVTCTVPGSGAEQHGAAAAHLLDREGDADLHQGGAIVAVDPSMARGQDWVTTVTALNPDVRVAPGP